MWADVELRDIRTFLTVAEELHFGRAAERLGVTPSRVSQTIRVLEDLLGGRLFDRTSRRVRLTALGQQLQREAAPSYQRLDGALRAARETATGVAGPLRLGMYSPASGGARLLQIVKTFQARHPRCRVELIDTGFARNPLDWLHGDEVEALAMRLPLDDSALVIGPILSRERRALLLPSEHALAARRTVRYDDLAGFPVPFTPVLPRELIDAVVPPRTPSGRRMARVQVHSTTEVLMRVAAGELVHPTVPSFLRYHPGAGLTTVPVSDLPPSETALVWSRARASARVEAFARVAEEVLRPAS